MQAFWLYASMHALDPDLCTEFVRVLHGLAVRASTEEQDISFGRVVHVLTPRASTEEQKLCLNFCRAARRLSRRSPMD